MARYFRRKKLSKKGIIALVVAAIIIIGAIVGIAIAINNANAERKTLSLNYAVGGLSETGAYKASETSIYTKSAFACEGLEIDIDDNSDVKFEVYYYGKSGAFISSTGMMSKDYVAELENGEKSARIVITPTFSQPIEENDVAGYAKQLTVSVSNNQINADDVNGADMTFYKFEGQYKYTIKTVSGSTLFDSVNKEYNSGCELACVLFFDEDYNFIGQGSFLCDYGVANDETCVFVADINLTKFEELADTCDVFYRDDAEYFIFLPVLEVVNDSVSYSFEVVE